MMFTTVKELTLRGLNLNSLEIEFNNRIFSRGPDFSKTMLHVALEFCENYPQSNCIIVEDKHYFTIWIEKSIKKDRDLPKKQENPVEQAKSFQEKLFGLID